MGDAQALAGFPSSIDDGRAETGAVYSFDLDTFQSAPVIADGRAAARRRAWLPWRTRLKRLISTRRGMSPERGHCCGAPCGANEAFWPARGNCTRFIGMGLFHLWCADHPSWQAHSVSLLNLVANQVAASRPAFFPTPAAVLALPSRRSRGRSCRHCRRLFACPALSRRTLYLPGCCFHLGDRHGLCRKQGLQFFGKAQ